MKHLLKFLLRLLFRFEAFNEQVLATPGPVLLLPNHVSWLDWLFLGASLEKDWRFVTSNATAQSSWLHRRIMINHRTFPIDTASPYAVKRMSEYLQKGGRLVLFAEGRITRTGTLMKLFDGTGFLLSKTQAKVITCYLRGAQRLRWVRHDGWTQWFPRVTAHYSGVLLPPKVDHMSTAEARRRLTIWLRDRMIEQQFGVDMEHGPRTVWAAIAEMAGQRPRQVIMEDVTRQQLTYRRLMAGSELFAQQWATLQESGKEERIGVLLPNLNATPVLILSLWAAGKVPAILNFSTGTATMLACARLSGLKLIVTSRQFLERAKLKIDSLRDAGIQFVYLEDVRNRISTGAKAAALLRQRLYPPSPTAGSIRPEAAAVVLFTSGSEGVPKGVELTHANLLANIRQMLAVTDLKDSDRLFNALPLFHSFGLTIGTLLPLVRGLYVFVYPSPLHYRVVPAAVYDRDCTVLLGTNTFLQGYARKAHPYDFRSLRYLFAGAEKLQEATATQWARRFGVRILEGYGATECGPALSVNTPMEPLPGSTGRLLPGIDYKLESVEGVAEGGRLFVRGPNIMKGYLNPEANEKFQALGGWYDTGDIARVDEERFVFILGRLKRFAKISGEMVSLTAVEDALAGAFPHYGLRCQVAILSQPDDSKGEALVAIVNEPRLTVEETRAVLKAKGFTNLCVPREMKHVREIPKLGTGKVNHRELEKLIRSA